MLSRWFRRCPVVALCELRLRKRRGTPFFLLKLVFSGVAGILLSVVAEQLISAQAMAQDSMSSKAVGNQPEQIITFDPLAGTTSAISENALPDAPVPAFAFSSSSGTNLNESTSVLNTSKPQVALRDCPYDQTKAKECRVHWRQLLISSAVFITWQNTANVYSSYWYRYETTTGKWWDRYINSVTGYKFSVWSDGNPYLDDYVGHPFMGAITNALWIQNDPKGMTLEFSNTWPYWRSRLRALAFSTVYSTEWKLGPIGESGVGHQGDHISYDDGHARNETGFVSLVTTPVGGTLWTITEDIMDKKVVSRLEQWNRNPFLLMGYSFLTPAHTTGNLLRFRPPWYRDSRTVKANSFWSDPEPSTSASAGGGVSPESVEDVRNTTDGGPEALVVQPTPQPQQLILPGGTHELGAWWGLSLMSGHLWGDAGDVKYMPIDVRYSYRFLLHERWALRYSPEITALAMIDWPTPQGLAPYELRKRSYGSGLSPEGFQADFFPRSRVQPFLSNNAGFIYFADKVLSTQGSQFMYTVDFGAGINIFRKERQVVTIGYRYQHLANADISLRNPGTDANIFYVGVSRFRTKGERATVTR
jgi:Lipid A 3-O-deacylase (PagL)